MSDGVITRMRTVRSRTADRRWDAMGTHADTGDQCATPPRKHRDKCTLQRDALAIARFRKRQESIGDFRCRDFGQRSHGGGRRSLNIAGLTELIRPRTGGGVSDNSAGVAQRRRRAGIAPNVLRARGGPGRIRLADRLARSSMGEACEILATTSVTRTNVTTDLGIQATWAPDRGGGRGESTE